ncbi:MAG: hypothetical protein D6784_17330 [Chloroflexi bacterium]|nr:MAG: hypothetical protein D6784_17330 [Chloroflexota bacterium]
MEILWYGHACFRLKDKNSTIITDPYDASLGLSLGRLKADIVTVSHDNPHHNNVAAVKKARIIDSPGEYEIGGTFVTGINLSPPRKKDGVQKLNNIFVFRMDSINICHLGDLSHVPTQTQVEDLENIDILLVPVGGGRALNASQAAEVISLIEPAIVIPMHYRLPNLAIKLDPVDKFLKEMGITRPDHLDSLKISKSSLPDEMQVVLLKPKI